MLWRIFIRNRALKGIDHWIIDACVGHTTKEIRKRYMHVYSSAEQAAIQVVLDNRAIISPRFAV